MLENVVTPVPVKVAPEASFVVPVSLVSDTSVRIPPADGRAAERRRGRRERGRRGDGGDRGHHGHDDESSHVNPSLTAPALRTRPVELSRGACPVLGRRHAGPNGILTCRSR